jgi:hypothetical protein
MEKGTQKRSYSQAQSVPQDRARDEQRSQLIAIEIDYHGG